MAEGPPRSLGEARRRLRARLADLGEPLRILAEEIRGEEERSIDWVAALPNGQVVIALLRLGEGDAELLAEGLVQRAWVATRLRDWEKLAPGLEIRADLPPVLLLIAAGFPRALRIAAREADGEGLWLAAHRWAPAPGGPRPTLEHVHAPEPARRTAPDRVAVRSIFRTGLADEDLALPPL